LSAFGLSPNKALGQNFLADEAALSALLAALPEGRLPALEIGPGLGALTAGLLACAECVVASRRTRRWQKRSSRCSLTPA
jgi:16S rRNA A1518/A1519 N6-dimethyltransferase RsmA/KsgA/DIM1 with predicted DNA glycosylase/AP lyase activity